VVQRSFLKSIGRRPFAQGAIAAAAAAHIRAVRATTRWQTVNGAAAAAAWRGEVPVIVAFWHNRLMMMPYCWPSPEPFHMLISAHPDGRLIARTVAHFGIDAIAGSSRRGGSEALRTLVRKIKAGESVGITPDGPRGPRFRAGDGAVQLARLSGAPILPAAVGVSRRMVLSTWDRLIVALPFGRGAMVWGEPLVVPRDADDAAIAQYRHRLENEMGRVTEMADRLAGAAPIAPSPSAPSDEPADATA
jgi:lysophospholipid acyltransferase (LPLAT)-like uncharacterized protein